MNTKISLGNTELFELFIGRRVLKKDLLNSKGKIPVFSANVIEPFGYLDKSNIPDFSHDYVLWGIDGNFMLNVKTKHNQFATTDHCGCIKILHENILPEYIVYQLTLQGAIMGFDRSLRASLRNMENIEITLPTNEKGGFDLEKQKILVERYKKIDFILSKLKYIYNEMTKIRIESNSDEGNFIDISLGDIKHFIVDNGERIRKTDIDKAKGKIPVFSASKFKDETLGYVSDKILDIVPNAKKFNGEYITVNADGSVGKVFLRNEEFYANDVLNVITIVNKQILPKYVLYELQYRILSLGFASWGYKLYKEKLRTISIRIPITKNGKVNTERQIEMIKIYEKTDEIKNGIIEKLSELIESKVDLMSEEQIKVVK